MRTHVLASRHGRASRGWRARVGLADCPKRERTKRGQTAGGETGTSEKAAAIKSAACFKRKCRNMHAAPGFTSCPFDQHECPSLRWIAVNPIKGLNFRRVGLIVSPGLIRELVGIHRAACACARRRGPNREHAKKIPAPDFACSAAVDVYHH